MMVIRISIEVKNILEMFQVLVSGICQHLSTLKQVCRHCYTMLCNIGMLYYIAKMLNNKACTPCNAEKDIENDTGGIN